MINVGLVANGHTTDPDNLEWYQSSAVCHDAAYAHALVMAMDWYKDNARHGHVAEVAIALIYKRSDEIMAGWGYPDD